MKKAIEIIGLIAILIAVGLFLLSCMLIVENPYLTHNEKLKENILSLNETQEIILNDFVPFDWDTMYAFEKGTTKEEIEEIIGFKNSKIKDVLSNKEVAVIFVKDGKITAYPQLDENVLGYNFNIIPKGKTYGVIHNYEYAVMYVHSKNNVVQIADLNIVRENINEYVY